MALDTTCVPVFKKIMVDLSVYMIHDKFSDVMTYFTITNLRCYRNLVSALCPLHFSLFDLSFMFLVFFLGIFAFPGVLS